MPEISTENFHLFLLAQTFYRSIQCCWNILFVFEHLCVWKNTFHMCPFTTSVDLNLWPLLIPTVRSISISSCLYLVSFFLVLLSQFFCAPFNFAAVQKTYLVWFCMNILGRHLISGNLKQEVVFDIVDRKCMHIFGSVLGWKYLNAQEVSFT